MAMSIGEIAAVAVPASGAALAALGLVWRVFKESRDIVRQQRDAARDDQTKFRDAASKDREEFMKLAREQAAHRRDFAQEQRDAYERHVEALKSTLAIERNVDRQEELARSLRESQDDI